MKVIVKSHCDLVCHTLVPIVGASAVNPACVLKSHCKVANKAFKVQQEKDIIK